MRYSNSETQKNNYVSLLNSAEYLYKSLSKKYVEKKGDKGKSMFVLKTPILFRYFEMYTCEWRFVRARRVAIPSDGWAILIYPDDDFYKKTDGKSIYTEKDHPIDISLTWADKLFGQTEENVLPLILLNEQLEEELSK